MLAVGFGIQNDPLMTTREFEHALNSAIILGIFERTAFGLQDDFSNRRSVSSHRLMGCASGDADALETQFLARIEHGSDFDLMLLHRIKSLGHHLGQPHISIGALG